MHLFEGLYGEYVLVEFKSIQVELGHLCPLCQSRFMSLMSVLYSDWVYRYPIRMLIGGIMCMTPLFVIV